MDKMQTDTTLIGIVSAVVLSLLGLLTWLVKTLVTKISAALHDMRNVVVAASGKTDLMESALANARSENTRALSELTTALRSAPPAAPCKFDPHLFAELMREFRKP